MIDIRKSLILLFSVLVPFALHADAKKPNFVVIFADDLGYGDLSCFGHPTIKTPNLDEMAAEGQKWTNFYVAACVCTPSRAGLMTGRLPIRNGMCSDERRVLFPDSSGGLPPSEITIASALKEQGYQTAAIGKWHLGHLPQYLPTSHGFDSYFGIPYSNDMSKIGKESHFDLAEKEDWTKYDVPLLRDERVVEQPVDQRTLTKRYTDEAVKKIDEMAGQPFFLYLAHSLPHVPLFRSAEFKGKSTNGIYGDVVEEIDWSVGQVRAALKKAGVENDTLVVFTSDNGPWLKFKTHGGNAGMLRDGKGSTWEGGMREPTVFSWPGTIKPGIVHGMGATLDLLPTFVSLAGGTLPDDRVFDGYDLSGFLEGTVSKSPRDTMFYYHGEQLYAVRKGEFKAHFKTKTSYVGQKEAEVFDPPLLFELGYDPGEHWNVQAENPEVASELTRIAKEHTAGVERVPSQLVGKIGE